jgi:hypothetical protein
MESVLARARAGEPSMNDNRAAVAHANHALEVFAAELTAAVYPVALRHGVGDKWLDLELELWRVLTETVKKWERELPRAGCPGDADLPFSAKARS